MSFLSKIFKKKETKPLPMHPNNILIISSSAKELVQSIEILTSKYGYSTNSDIIRMDNGDFAQVISKKDS